MIAEGWDKNCYINERYILKCKWKQHWLSILSSKASDVSSLPTGWIQALLSTLDNLFSFFFLKFHFHSSLCTPAALLNLYVDTEFWNCKWQSFYHFLTYFIDKKIYSQRSNSPCSQHTHSFSLSVFLSLSQFSPMELSAMM